MKLVPRIFAGALVLACLVVPTAAQNPGLAPGGSLYGNPAATSGVPAYTRVPVLGVPGSVLGTLGFAGNTSGAATLRAQAAAGTPTILLPTTSGTLALTTSPAGAIVVGTTTVTSGTSNGILFNNAGVLGNTASANSSVLVTNGSGVPAFSTTLPAFTLGGTVTGGGNSLTGISGINTDFTSIVGTGGAGFLSLTGQASNPGTPSVNNVRVFGDATGRPSYKRDDGFARTFASTPAGDVVWTMPAVTATLLYSGGPLGTPSSGTLTNATGLPIGSGVSGLGTGVATALGTNIGSAGSFVVNGGALGSPSSAGTMPAFVLGGAVTASGSRSFGIDLSGGTYSTATLLMPNNLPLSQKDSGGTTRNLLNLQSDGALILGSGAHNIFVNVPPSTGGIVPFTDNSFGLGGASNRWASVHTLADKLYGATSGVITLQATATAGTNTITLPAATGTVALTAGATIPSVATGDILYGSATNTLSALADVATGNALISGGVGVAPAWGKIGISTHVSGLGTGIATALGVNVGSAGAPVLFNGALGSPSSAGTMPAFVLGGAVTASGSRTTGIDLSGGTFSTSTILFPNGVPLQQKDSGGTTRNLIYITGADAMIVGNANQNIFLSPLAGVVPLTDNASSFGGASNRWVDWHALAGKLYGSTSGVLTLTAAAVSGSSAIKFPGGTTDFSATGGTGQFVKQASAGAALTVIQPAFTDLTGSVAAAQMPALTGDITTSAGAVATTLATVASAGTTGSSTAIPIVTINAKGLTTSVSTAAVIAPAGTLTGTTLAANVVSSSLTSVSLGTLTATATAATGQLPGTTTNDNAAAGKVGEYMSASNEETALQGAGSATVTITIASPAVVTWGTTTPFGCNGAGGAAVNFTTTGALPTGIVAGTNYYAICSSISGNTFQIATSVDNAVAGTAINTSGSQSGTQTGVPMAILATGVQTDVSGFQLTAGDWDVTADLGFSVDTTTSVTATAVGHSSTSASQSSIPGRRFRIATAAQVPNGNNIYHAGPGRYSLSGNQTIYCVALSTFTVSFMNAWGGCRARRMR